MKSIEKLPMRFDSSELLKPVGGWLLPEVNGRHTIGIQTKVPEPVHITVVDEEMAAEKITLSELEAIRDSAYQEGFESGKEEGRESGHAAGDLRGYTEGIERGKADIDRQVLKFEEILLKLDEPLSSQHDQLAELVTELSIHIAQAVIRHQGAECKDIVQASVADAIAVLPKQSGELVITVNPDDVSALASLAERHQERWKLIGDAKMAPGGCIISTDTSVVDYCMESRFSAVIKEVKDRLEGQKYSAKASLNRENGDESV
ncbi:flagellar assembly protein FliH [Neptunomonas antarctica]|uniref:flagellar assembly protein FliH n=1 Tax=Neptunomonas antarctica TaxID=619304 RepID=UPI0006C81BE6|nr:flagellar assembly protein FliH [Neptunomonas antarctica]